MKETGKLAHYPPLNHSTPLLYGHVPAELWHFQMTWVSPGVQNILQNSSIILVTQSNSLIHKWCFFGIPVPATSYVFFSINCMKVTPYIHFKQLFHVNYMNELQNPVDYCFDHNYIYFSITVMPACFIVFCDLSSICGWSQNRKRPQPTTCWFDGTSAFKCDYSRGKVLSG